MTIVATWEPWTTDAPRTLDLSSLVTTFSFDFQTRPPQEYEVLFVIPIAPDGTALTSFTGGPFNPVELGFSATGDGSIRQFSITEQIAFQEVSVGWYGTSNGYMDPLPLVHDFAGIAVPAPGAALLLACGLAMLAHKMFRSHL